MSVFLPELDKKVIASLKRHCETGVQTDFAKIQMLCQAVEKGKISISRVPDEDSTFDNLIGDYMVGETPQVIGRRRASFNRSVREHGVWTMVSRYWNGREWEDLVGIEDNSISGLVGHDFFGSNYEAQLMEAALDAYNAQDLDDDGFVVDPFRRVAA